MEISKNSSSPSSSSLNTVEALILGTRFSDSISAPVQSEEGKAKKRRRSSKLRRKRDDDDDHHHLFNPCMSSSFSSTDKFDPIKNYPSISSLEIDSSKHSHQSMEVVEEQRGTREERMKVKSSCSIVTGISVIKEKRRSSVMKRKKKEMMDPSLHLTSLVSKDEKRKSSFVTPQAKRLNYSDRECDRDRDFELMPPPDSHKKSVPASFDVDQPIDPNEPTYCVCHQVSHGDMIACNMDNCQGGEWFHYSCVGLTPETRFKGNWYCPTCKLLPCIMSKAIALESWSQCN